GPSRRKEATLDTNRLFPPLLEQRVRLLQVGRVEALGEPAIHLRQQVAGLIALALLLPEPTQGHGGAQLPGFSLLAARYAEGLLEAGFRADGVRLAQQECPLEPVGLREQAGLSAGLHLRQGLSQQAQPLLNLAGMPRGFGERNQIEGPSQLRP